MKELKWDLLKNERLKRARGVSFEELIQSRLVSIKEHPQRPDQKIMLFELKGYIWIVPFVEDADHIFLKTLYPSRKFTRLYKSGEIT
ncbi:MAG: hypothetical protein A2705_02000 [Omnitrophica WOR_2 bacterium RIFCSPHIGHO2_01_FULL_52_10]|nr:MAG: hypothetical protein A2705_02000 [Omnitrophica WOR_2 bacterium RIFCSPHIGHO2_01_FULL_52_10]